MSIVFMFYRISSNIKRMWKLKLNTSFKNKCYYYHHYTLEMKLLELYALDLKKKILTQPLNQCRDSFIRLD